jgi:hypothetical protein
MRSHAATGCSLRTRSSLGNKARLHPGGSSSLPSVLHLGFTIKSPLLSLWITQPARMTVCSSIGATVIDGTGARDARAWPSTAAHHLHRDDTRAEADRILDADGLVPSRRASSTCTPPISLSYPGRRPPGPGRDHGGVGTAATRGATRRDAFGHEQRRPVTARSRPRLVVADVRGVPSPGSIGRRRSTRQLVGHGARLAVVGPEERAATAAKLT